MNGGRGSKFANWNYVIFNGPQISCTVTTLLDFFAPLRSIRVFKDCTAYNASFLPVLNLTKICTNYMKYFSKKYHLVLHSTYKYVFLCTNIWISNIPLWDRFMHMSFFYRVIKYQKWNKCDLPWFFFSYCQNGTS